MEMNGKMFVDTKLIESSYGTILTSLYDDYLAYHLGITHSFKYPFKKICGIAKEKVDALDSIGFNNSRAVVIREVKYFRHLLKVCNRIWDLELAVTLRQCNLLLLDSEFSLYEYLKDNDNLPS